MSREVNVLEYLCSLCKMAAAQIRPNCIICMQLCIHTTRRLVTTNRLRISIRVTKAMARAVGGVNPVKLFLTSSLITMQNMVAVSHAVCMHIGSRKNFGDTWGMAV